MTLFRRRNSQDGNTGSGLISEPYLFLNIFFAGVIMMVIIYSGIFSPDRNNYPVVCLHEMLTGKPCISCGLSHSFSLIVRGRLDEAYQWNIYGMRIFLFFIFQLLLRIVFSFYYLRIPGQRKQLIIFDITGSILLFLISFWPFIENIIHSTFMLF